MGTRALRMRSVIKILIILVCCAGFLDCDNERDWIVNELKRLELTDYEDRDLDKKTEQELLRGIRFLEGEVKRTVDAGTHLGTYYKLVAIEYRKREMYGLAAEYFERALTVSPRNAYLAYWTGVCYAQIARAIQIESREDTLETARSYYEYAVEVNPKYTEALYALAVLLVFEYDELSSAKPLLERILLVESLDFRAMFLLARIHVVEGQISEAVDLYERIIDDSTDELMVSEARGNRNELLGGRR